MNSNTKNLNVIDLADRQRNVRRNLLLDVMQSLDPADQIVNLYKAFGLTPQTGRDVNFMWPGLVAMLVMRIDEIDAEVKELRYIIGYPFNNGGNGGDRGKAQ